MTQPGQQASPLDDIWSSTLGATQLMWLEHAPRYLVPLRDVRERDAGNPHGAGGAAGPGDRFAIARKQWDDEHGSSNRVIFPAGTPAPYRADGSVLLVTAAEGERWRFGSWQVTGSSAACAGPDTIFRMATGAERTAELHRLGTWTTGTGRVIHFDQDGLWAEPLA